MKEIERKFLVKNNSFKTEFFQKNRIIQGYISRNPERNVRVRISGDSGFITIKGKSDQSGTTRFEWEKEIPLSEAKLLMELCEPGIIDKIRYKIQSGNHVIEVDEFFGKNSGLILAEIELKSENESYQKPNWLGKEVTGEKEYYNSYLSQNPFSEWNLL